jgi:hypothetical protein
MSLKLNYYNIHQIKIFMMKKNHVSLPSTNLFSRVYPSINNMFMLGIVLFSVFLVYRYVKSLEKEVKVLADKINTIQYKPQSVEPSIVFHDDMKKECDSNEVCFRSNGGVDDTSKAYENEDEDDDHDHDSVKSEDIMKMINKIHNDVSEENEAPNREQQESVQNDNEPLTTIDSFIENNTENKEEKGFVLEDDFVIKKAKSEYSVLDADGLSEESLLKKTNDDLRKILKDQGKNTKGLKNDLIKRILEE